MSFKGNPATLKAFAKKIRQLPKVLAIDVATRVAPSISGLARSAYTGGQTVYGDARPTGVHGNFLTLVQSGATLAAMRFVSVGTRVRARLGTKYARYLIGDYRILPMGSLPAKWSEQIAEDSAAEIQRGLAH